MNERPSASTGLAEGEGDPDELGEEDPETLAVGIGGKGERLAAVELPFVHAAAEIVSATTRVMDRAGLITCED